MPNVKLDITCGEALDLLAAIRMIRSVPMPPLGGFPLNKALSVLTGNPDVQAANGVRQAALVKWGKEQGDGNYQVPAENIPFYFADFRQVSFLPVTLDLPSLPSVVRQRVEASELEINPQLLDTLTPLWESDPIPPCASS